MTERSDAPQERALVDRLRSREWDDRQHRELRAKAADRIDELEKKLIETQHQLIERNHELFTAVSETSPPVAWIATKGDAVHHYAQVDGWNVEPVMNATPQVALNGNSNATGLPAPAESASSVAAIYDTLERVFAVVRDEKATWRKGMGDDAVFMALENIEEAIRSMKGELPI